MIQKYIRFDIATGDIIGHGSMSKVALPLQSSIPGFLYVDDFDFSTHKNFKVVNNQIVEKTSTEMTDTEAAEFHRMFGFHVNKERDARIRRGRAFTVTGYLVPIDLLGTDRDRANISDLALKAQIMLISGDTTTLTYFRDANNVTHALAPAEMVELFNLGSGYLSAVHQAAVNLKALAPSQRPLDVQDDSHWPSTI